jgi:hypothetical protein
MFERDKQLKAKQKQAAKDKNEAQENSAKPDEEEPN